MFPVNQQLIRSFSDNLRQDNPGEIIGRGLSTAIAIDKQRERNSAALRDQWNVFLAEGRQLAIEYDFFLLVLSLIDSIYYFCGLSSVMY